MRFIFKVNVLLMTIILVVSMTGCDGKHKKNWWPLLLLGSSISSPSGVTESVCSGGACVNLQTAGNFVLLATSTITDANLCTITGDIGLSPAAGSAIIVTCPEMTGKIYTVDGTYVGSGDTSCAKPGPGANKTTVDNAVADAATARTAAAAKAPDKTVNLYAGILDGQTLAPGVYKWTTDVTIGVTLGTNVTLSGSSTDVWVFQISGKLDLASKGSVPAGIKVLLTGGAQASHVFWQVVGQVTLGTYSTFNGIILGAANVAIQHGAVLNGRAFSGPSNQVTLDANTITNPITAP